MRLFHLHRQFIHVTIPEHDPDGLEIRAVGPMLHVMLFEIYVLSTVNELYFRQFPQDVAIAEGRRRIADKLTRLDAFAQEPPCRFPFVMFDFGTRRRFSRAWHEEIIAGAAARPNSFIKGTSNVELARIYNLTPIGTMAHEYLQAFQSFGSRLRDFQKKNALEHWVREYRGDLGIALTDIVGMDAFFARFRSVFLQAV